MKYIFSFFILAFLAQGLFAQKVTVQGVVKDGATGETLPYVAVGIVGSSKGVITNVDGQFTLFDLVTDTSTLLFSYVGYENLKFKLNPEMLKQTIKVEMKQVSYKLKSIEIKTRAKTIDMSDDASHISINPRQLEILPNMGEVDIFRGIQLLPGISGSNESSSGLYVRGGTPDQNLVLLDGITVYHVDHFFGIFSAFNAKAIKDVQVFKGGFEAKYGGRISSVVDMTAKDGNTRKITLGFGANLLSSNILAEVPVLKGKGSFIFTGRRSYTDFIKSETYNKLFNNVTEQQDDGGLGFGIGGFGQVDPTFHFFDMNSKFTFRPTDKDALSVSFFNSKDHLDNSSSQDFGFGGGDSKLETTDITDWGNRGASFNYSRKWTNHFYSNLTTSFSNYYSDYSLVNDFTFDTITFSFSTIQNNDVQDVTIRLDNTYEINNNQKIEFGYWGTQFNIKYINTLDDTVKLQDLQDSGNMNAAYLQHSFKLEDKFSLKYGLRGTHYDVNDKFYIEPRASASVKLAKGLRVKGAWGIYKQFVNRVILENIFGGSRDFWVLANDTTIPVMSAEHYIAGISYENSDWMIDVEVYKKDMSGLLEYSLRYGTLEEQLENAGQLYYSGVGQARGAELLVQRKFGRFTGWLAYTLGEVVYNFPDLNNGKKFPALHDTRHELKLVAMMKLGAFDLSSTFVYATGKPYTEPIGQYEITLLNGQTTQFVHVGDKNSSRLPDYHRLDFALSYNFDVKDKLFGKSGISLFNIYARQNIKYKRFQLLDYDPETFMPQEPELVTTEIKLLGFVPNIFLNLIF